MRMRILLAVSVLLVAVALSPAGAAGVVVKPTLANRWSPAIAKVTKGSTVTWKASPDAIHTLKSYQGTWMPLTDLAPGETVRKRFRKTGTFKYVCTTHGHWDAEAKECHGMCGKVKVTAPQ